MQPCRPRLRSLVRTACTPCRRWLSSPQALQQQLHARLRLPPLNPKASPPLKLLASGLGSLVAGPAGEGGELLQWAPSEAGTTLPRGGHACAREDHDSAACAELRPVLCDGGGAGSAGSKCRVSCLLLAPGPGWLWAGCTDGTVHCWALGHDGAAARWIHAWVAHSGKVKALAVTPSGRLLTGALLLLPPLQRLPLLCLCVCMCAHAMHVLTPCSHSACCMAPACLHANALAGSANGAIKMWSYGSPAYSDTAPPRPLRQLRKQEPRGGTSSNPHSKVVGLAVAASGRVLWSAGKNTVSLWSAYSELPAAMQRQSDVLSWSIALMPAACDTDRSHLHCVSAAQHAHLHHLCLHHLCCACAIIARRWGVPGDDE